MRRWLALAAAVLLSACVTTYGPMGLTHHGGYKEKRLSDSSWSVTTNSTGLSDANMALDMALFRAAVLGKANGFRIIHIVNFEIVDTKLYRTPTGQQTKLTFLATNDPNLPLQCMAKKRFLANCRILPVDALLREKGRALDLSPEQIEQEVAHARQAMQTH